MPVYPKYHPPIDWPYAVAPAGREYRVLPSPAQRIGKKEARLWGATVQNVPYAYEDPYLTSVQDTQYTVDSSMMHRYPYLREDESAPRFPMLFQQPFGSANMQQQGSANYLDSYAYDEDEESSEDDDFGFDIGDALKKAQGFIKDNRIKQRIKDGKGIIASVQRSGIFGKKSKTKKIKRRSSKRKSRSAKSSSYKKGKIPAFLKAKGLPFASKSFQSVAKLATDAQAMQNIPEPTPFSNLFAQAAENDKVNVKARITAGQQVPILVRETQPRQMPEPRQMVVSEQLHSAEVELTKRAQDAQKASEKLEKSQNKNNVLLYTSIGGGVVTLGLLSYLLISRK